MEQKIILAAIIIVSLIAHIWIYRWIKFKMDEGAVLRYLKDLPQTNSSEKTHINMPSKVAELITMRESRVIAVCEKSADIRFENGLCMLKKSDDSEEDKH